MHESVMKFAKRCLTPELLGGCDVLEVGSLNVNGSVRDFAEPLSAIYLGIDIVPGPGVDLLLDAAFVKPWDGELLNVVVCTEMLEHAYDWRRAINSMKGVLEPGGHILLTTRSIGFARHHEHPGDFWRFSVEQMRDIFSDFEILALEPDPGGSGGGPGVFLFARKPLEWHERDLSDIEVYSMENEP